jgi:hypothetical protein
LELPGNPMPPMILAWHLGELFSKLFAMKPGRKLVELGAPACSDAEIQVNRQIPPEPHTAMYVWHKYWSRKTWNVVAEFIRSYTREQDVVFDPFAGSGVVAIEAVRHKRRAIVCDLNPAASRITELTLRPVNLLSLQQAFERVAERTRQRIEKLYEAHCLKCGKPLTAACFVRQGGDLTEVRYPSCPWCEHRCETGCSPRKEDVESVV